MLETCIIMLDQYYLLNGPINTHVLTQMPTVKSSFNTCVEIDSGMAQQQRKKFNCPTDQIYVESQKSWTKKLWIRN